MLRRILLVCGILASLHYFAINVFVPFLYPGYSFASHTISELSAIRAPTRTLWIWLSVPYSLLAIAFGFGVWMSGKRNRLLRAAGMALIVNGIVCVFWPPMHMRGAGFSLTDILHIAFAMVNLVLMMLAMALSALVLGKSFRLYALATIAVIIGTGVMIGLDSPHIAPNLPTPWVGMWERISAASMMLWLIVFATALLRYHPEAVPENHPPRPQMTVSPGRA